MPKRRKTRKTRKAPNKRARTQDRRPDHKLPEFDLRRFAEESGLTIEEAAESVTWLEEQGFLTLLEDENGRFYYAMTIPDKNKPVT